MQISNNYSHLRIIFPSVCTNSIINRKECFRFISKFWTRRNLTDSRYLDSPNRTMLPTTRARSAWLARLVFRFISIYREKPLQPSIRQVPRVRCCRHVKVDRERGAYVQRGAILLIVQLKPWKEWWKKARGKRKARRSSAPGRYREREA